MTEDKAKTKWCPFVRLHISPNDGMVYSSLAGTAIATEGGDVAVRCIGSACMAWRWDWDADAGRTNAERKSGASKVGYCGLAGKP